MKKLNKLVLALFTVAILSSSVFANGLSLNSIGVRAMGMGGAFIGLANDGSAIYWNPAGLVGLDSKLNLYGSAIMPSGYYKYDLAGIDATMKSNTYLTGGFFYNRTMGKLALGLGVYVPAGLGAEWDPADLGVPASIASNYKLSSQLGAVTFSPAIAYQVSDKFSVGLTINVTYAMFDMNQTADGSALGLGLYQFEESSTGIGYGATLGLKYNFSDKFSAGATVRLATKVSMSGTAKNPLFAALPTIPGVVQPGPAESDFDRDVTWPMWIGGGIAYQASKKLTFALDAQFSQWSELDKLAATYNDAYWDATMKSSGQDEFKLNWIDAVQIRAGAEYMFSKTFTGRLGYYYDPAPAPDETLNFLFPSSTNNVVTGGFTWNMGSFFVEAAGEYLMGAEREVVPSGDNMPGKHQLDIFAFGVGVGFAL